MPLTIYQSVKRVCDPIMVENHSSLDGLETSWSLKMFKFKCSVTLRFQYSFVANLPNAKSFSCSQLLYYIPMWVQEFMQEFLALFALEMLFCFKGIIMD